MVSSITEVARGVFPSKSSMADALPSDRLPGSHQEVTLKCMCGRAEMGMERTKTEVGEGTKQAEGTEREQARHRETRLDARKANGKFFTVSMCTGANLQHYGCLRLSAQNCG